MDDRALVAALVSGDPRGLEGVYRTYADRLYTYCRGMLRDGDAAADAVHDTFLLASQRAGQLRDPERLRPWLYAIARNECLRQLRARVRQVPLAEAGQVSTESVDPGTGMQAAELQELVWTAADGLNPGDREVFELAVRHELPALEVGAALGVSLAHAHARLSRARAQLERALGALLLARTGRQECPELAELLHGWDGRWAALLRKRVGRHAEECDRCGERRRQQLSPAALFSAYAGLPMFPAAGDTTPPPVLAAPSSTPPEPAAPCSTPPAGEPTAAPPDPPAPTGTASPAAGLRADVWLEAECVRGTTVIEVSAVASRPLDRDGAVLVLAPDSGDPARVPMAVAGARARVEDQPVRRAWTWWVEVTDLAGGQAATESQPLPEACATRPPSP